MYFVFFFLIFCIKKKVVTPHHLPKKRGALKSTLKISFIFLEARPVCGLSQIDRSHFRPIEILSDFKGYLTDRVSKRKKNKKLFSARVLHFFKQFSLLFVFFSLDRSNTSIFCHFPPQIFKGFCPQLQVRAKYPSFFQFIYIFHAFSSFFLN